MNEIIGKIQNWHLLDKLPVQFSGFQLSKELKQEKMQYCIFKYDNFNNRSLEALYDFSTKDFLVRIVIGLTEYYDVNFIAGDLTTFETLLTNKLESTLYQMVDTNNKQIESIVREKKILEWAYGSKLAKEMYGFKLFISPNNPVKIINGSYVIIDYSDFFNKSSLLIYYNIFRDEFFGELRVHRTPEMTTVFDSKTLSELEERIDANLATMLKKLRARLD